MSMDERQRFAHRTIAVAKDDLKNNREATAKRIIDFANEGFATFYMFVIENERVVDVPIILDWRYGKDNSDSKTEWQTKDGPFSVDNNHAFGEEPVFFNINELMDNLYETTYYGVNEEYNEYYNKIYQDFLFGTEKETSKIPDTINESYEPAGEELELGN